MAKTREAPISSSYGLSRPSQGAILSSDEEEDFQRLEDDGSEDQQELDLEDTEDISEDEDIENAEEDLKEIDFASLVGAQKTLSTERRKDNSSLKSAASSKRKEQQEEIKNQLAKLKASRGSKSSPEYTNKKRVFSDDSGHRPDYNGDDDDDEEEDSDGSSSSGSDSSSDDDQEEDSHQSRYKRAKRLNKHAPQEVTSKRPVTRLRQVVDVPKIIRRDPRFEPVGHRSNVDPRQLRKDYAFLQDYEKDEIKQMELDLKRTKDPQDKYKLQRAIQSKKSRLQTLADKDFADKIIMEHERKEREAVKEGKKPYYLKDSEKKKLILGEKFKTMKKSEITKKVARRERKQTAKSRKQIPEARIR